MSEQNNIAIIGTGNIGSSIAQGLVQSSNYAAENITLTRRKTEHLADFKEQGFNTTSNNIEAVERSNIVIVCVEPHQIDSVLQTIDAVLDKERHVLISVASGVSIDMIKSLIQTPVPVVRAMPNTAIAILESMTCLAAKPEMNTSSNRPMISLKLLAKF